tara:strand:+ start:476 stop:1141 length:666 start_codon:yes stop_codon:yes gene_type:complete
MPETLFSLSEKKLGKIVRLKRVISYGSTDSEYKSLLSGIALIQEGELAIINGFITKTRELKLFEISNDPAKILGVVLSIKRLNAHNNKFHLQKQKLFDRLYTLALMYNKDRNVGDVLIRAYNLFLDKEFLLKAIDANCSSLKRSIQDIEYALIEPPGQPMPIGNCEQAEQLAQQEVVLAKKFEDFLSHFPEIQRRDDIIKAAMETSKSIIQQIREQKESLV